MRLVRIPAPFDHPDFFFEPKLDGFRALAHVRGRRCELVSRNGHTFKRWPQLAEEIAHAVRAHNAVLDGKICCLEPDGRTHFNNLLFRREWPHFYAFDVLSIEGEDLTALPLVERKRRLLAIMPAVRLQISRPPARFPHSHSRFFFDHERRTTVQEDARRRDYSDTADRPATVTEPRCGRSELLC